MYIIFFGLNSLIIDIHLIKYEQISYSKFEFVFVFVDPIFLLDYQVSTVLFIDLNLINIGIKWK